MCTKTTLNITATINEEAQQENGLIYYAVNGKVKKSTKVKKQAVPITLTYAKVISEVECATIDYSNFKKQAVPITLTYAKVISEVECATIDYSNFNKKG